MKFGKIKYNNEILSGALFMIASAILWLLIPQQIQSLEKGMVTASTVPRIAIGGLFICALLLFVQGLRLPKKTIVLEKDMVSSPKFKKEFKSVIFALILLAYGLLFNVIGYIVDTALLVVAILLFYRSKKWWFYGIGIATVLLIYLVFSQVLNVNLPTLF